MRVHRSELCVAALTGAVFGVLGYWGTRHIHSALSRVGVR